MNEDSWLIAIVALVWAILAAVYALAPWGDMIGYAHVWGAGSLLFLGLAGLLAKQGGPPLLRRKPGIPEECARRMRG